MNAQESSAAAPEAAEPAQLPVVLTTGTPFGAWGAIAHALLAAAPQGTDLASGTLGAWCDSVLGDADARAERGAVSWLDGAGAAALPDGGTNLWGSVDARLVWAVDAVDASWPAARWIVFVEAPALALATRLARGAAFDAPALLAGWCAGAEALLKLLRRAGPRVVAIEAGEGRHEPGAAAHLLSQRLGIRFGKPRPPAAATLDPLALAAAEGLVAPLHRARTLHAELLAACAPLGDALPASPAAQDVQQRWSDLRRAAERAAAAGTELSALRGELEARTAQCEQMQEELEYFHAEIAALRKRPPSSASAGGIPVTLGSIAVRAERHAPPHRQLTLRIADIAIGDARLGPLDLRLVEHHGRPGIVVFGDAGRSPLTGWTETGQEDGRGYLLIVPADRNTHAAARRLSATDWRLVHALLDRLAVALATEASLAQPAFWALTATRLGQQFDEVDWGVAVDAASAAVRGGPQPGTAEVVLAGAQWGRRAVGALRVLIGTAGRVTLAGLDGRSLPPLPSWPHDGEGRPLEAWELPLGSAPGAARGPARWTGVTVSDHAFITALLEALPALLARAEFAGALQAAGAAESAAQLSALAREARASRPQPTLKQRAAAVLRRWRAR